MTPTTRKVRLVGLLGLVLVTAQAAVVRPFSASAIDARAAVPALRLMPLGASITYGQESSTGNGYRKDLYDMLTADGSQVDMVGSRQAGNMVEPNNEGWPGFRITEVNQKAAASVPSLLPNLYTVNVGTNDALQDFQLSSAYSRLDTLVEYLWGATPEATVILSTLIINLDTATESRVQGINVMIRDLVRNKAAEGKRVVLAEMHAEDGPQRADMADRIHPNDTGYTKMAVIWHRSIQEAISKGLVQES